AAADALVDHGDRAAALVRSALRDMTPATVEAVRVLARIRSPRARRLLARTVRELRADAETTSALLAMPAAHGDGAAHPPALDLTLRDHHRQLRAAARAIVLAALDAPLAPQLERALTGDDQRDRAKAFELLAARLSANHLAAALDLLRYLTVERGTDRVPGEGAATRQRGPLLKAAAGSLSPWVRMSARQAAANGSGPPVTAGEGASRGKRRMVISDELFERTIVLKRIPLFTDLPLNVLLAVAGAVSTRTWLEGDQVMPAGAERRGLLILESGRLSVDRVEWVAPACFGELALAGEAIVWPRVVALEDARGGFLDGLRFDELRQEHPELVIELCRHLARRLRHLEASARPAALTTVLPSPP
ncbi:MAG: hypothetical protein R3349_02075, partial [Geminicoccaceae bacterium]|nr:hypothetical protein [Geminicoccaceae bacterium]